MLKSGGIINGLKMKTFLRKVVLVLLKGMAKRRLKKFKGKIIGVTGSIGKTSTKDAIYTVLNSQMKVKRNENSMNSEFGLLLTILAIDSGYSSALKWSWLLAKAFYHSFFTDHCEVLLLELGVDKPKDMNYLLSVVKPDITVFTNVAPVHMAEGQFESMEAIFEEKRKLVDKMGDNSIAVLNIDDPLIARLAKERGKKNTRTYGKEKLANYHFNKISQTTEGLSYILHHGEERYEVLSQILGGYQAYVITPALVCADLLGIPMESAILAAGRFTLPPGRMSIIPGINDSAILDSSYNSSPEALKEALKVLREVGGEKRKVAVLGNMNELGEKCDDLHRDIGAIVPGCADLLITVGTSASLFAEEAIKKGMDEKKVHVFKTSGDASEFFKDEVKKGDTILVKGSQNRVRLERFVKAIMANPEDAKDLLVRQERVWEAKL